MSGGCGTCANKGECCTCTNAGGCVVPVPIRVCVVHSTDKGGCGPCTNEVRIVLPTLTFPATNGIIIYITSGPAWNGVSTVELELVIVPKV